MKRSLGFTVDEYVDDFTVTGVYCLAIAEMPNGRFQTCIAVLEISDSPNKQARISLTDNRGSVMLTDEQDWCETLSSRINLPYLTDGVLTGGKSQNDKWNVTKVGQLSVGHENPYRV